MTAYNIATWGLMVLLTCGVLFNCKGGGGSDRDHLRKEYQRDPEGFRKRWGV